MLQFIIGIIVLILLTWLPGAVITRYLFGPGGPPTTEKRERVFLAIITSVLLTGWLAFTLAEIGWFSVWLVLLIELVICFLLLLSAAGRLRDVPATARLWISDTRTTAGQAIRKPSWQVLILLGLLLVGGILYARPAEMIRGALDAGAYINAGVALGRSHTIMQHDQLMREFWDGLPAGAPSEAREFLQGLNPGRYTFERLRMPAFYVFDKQNAEVLPQHYSYFPAWIALFYQLFGLWGALYASPFLALIASAAIYFFAARIFSRSVGLLALGLLVVFPLQSWFARYPVSETPTQLLAFVFFYAFARFIAETQRLNNLEKHIVADDSGMIPEENEIARVSTSARFFATLAAVAVASIAFTRPDFPAFVIPVPLFMAWWWLSRGWRREHTWFALALLLLSGQWLIHFFFFTYGYTLDLYYNTIRNFRRAWPRILPAVYIGALLVVAIGLLRPRLQPLGGAIGAGIVRLRPWLLGGLSVLAAVYLFWRYILEPGILTPGSIWTAITTGAIPFDWQGYIGAPLKSVAETGKSNQTGLINTDSFILVRIGWYLSPLGILIGGIGLVRAIMRRLNAVSTAFFISFAVLTLVFVGETFTDPTYPYTMRRFMPVIIPAFLIFGAYALAWIGEKLKPRLLMRVGGWAAYAALIVFFIYTSLPMLNHIEDHGAVDEISALAARFPNPARTVLLFSNERDEPYVVATPLQYIFGLNVFSLNLPYGDTNPAVVQCAVERWLRQGYQVYAILGTNGGKIGLPTAAPQTCYRGDNEPGKDVPDQQLGLAPLADNASWTYNVPEFEQLYTQKPKNVQQSTLNWGIYNVVPATQVPQTTWPFSLDIGGFDFDYLVAGFAEKECHQNADKTCNAAAGYWRWTLQNALLRLPWQAAPGASATLTLRLAAGPVQRPTPADVQIYAGATLVGAAHVLPGDDFKEFNFTIPPQTGGDVIIRINSTVWSPNDAGVSADKRALGVRVDQVTIK